MVLEHGTNDACCVSDEEDADVHVLTSKGRSGSSWREMQLSGGLRMFQAIMGKVKDQTTKRPERGPEGGAAEKTRVGFVYAAGCGRMIIT